MSNPSGDFFETELKETPPPPPKVWSLKEKLLLLAALTIGVLFDRLVINSWFSSDIHIAMAAAAFWLFYLVVFYTFFWKHLKYDYIAWFVAGCTVALLLWNFIFCFGNFQFRSITFYVIPAVLMAHAQWSAHSFTLKTSEGMALAWLSGWAIKPFTGLHALAGAISSLLSNTNKPALKRALIGIIIALLMVAFILPLLMSADQVFDYYVSRMFRDISGFTFVFHSLVVITAAAFFYSFLWNIEFGENKTYRIPEGWSLDIIISAIALGSILLPYLLFCLIQFTYLFAGAGLPANMTYAEYAREGFAQTVTVCAVNLLMFCVFLRLGRGHKLLKALLLGLLALTGIMLASGAVRLNLYIAAYGMTWLRLLSAWFIVYLAAVIMLCAVRLLFKKELPVVALSALLLLIWYVALGYLNPDNFIDWFNMQNFI